MNILDRSGNEDASIAMYVANLTLTAVQVRRNGLLTLTGTLTATRVLTIPAGNRAAKLSAGKKKQMHVCAIA